MCPAKFQPLHKKLTAYRSVLVWGRCGWFQIWSKSIHIYKIFDLFGEVGLWGRIVCQPDLVEKVN